MVNRRNFNRRRIDGVPTTTTTESFNGTHDLTNFTKKMTWTADSGPTLTLDLASTHPSLNSSSGEIHMDKLEFKGFSISSTTNEIDLLPANSKTRMMSSDGSRNLTVDMSNTDRCVLDTTTSKFEMHDDVEFCCGKGIMINVGGNDPELDFYSPVHIAANINDHSEDPTQGICLEGNGARLAAIYAVKRPGSNGELAFDMSQGGNFTGTKFRLQNQGQMTQYYNASNSVTYTPNDSGDLTITPSGGNMLLNGTLRSINTAIGTSDTPQKTLHIYSQDVNDHIYMDYNLAQNGWFGIDSSGRLGMGSSGHIVRMNGASNFMNFDTSNDGYVALSSGDGVMRITDSMEANGGITTSTDNLTLNAAGIVELQKAMALNDNAFLLRNDANHALRYTGTVAEFAGSTSINGPVLHGYEGGCLGVKSGSLPSNEKICLEWDTSKVRCVGSTNAYLDIDHSNAAYTALKPSNDYLRIFEGSGGPQYLEIDNSNAGYTVLDPSGASGIRIRSDVNPTTDNTRDLGSSALQWKNIYTVNSVVVSSDARIKTIDRNIEGSKALSFINNLDPILYKRIDLEEEDPELRAGVTAQRVQTAKKGDFEDWSSILHSPKAENENDILGLRYQEFIPFLIATTQELSRQVNSLREEVQLWKTKAENNKRKKSMILKSYNKKQKKTN